MNIQKAKREATAAGLELYWEPQWRCWGLIDPGGMNQEESEWMSSGELHGMTYVQFGLRIAALHQKMHPDAGGAFPISEGVA